MNLHAELKKGVDYHRAQKLDRAQQTYTGILQVDPRHPEAIHLLGLIAYQSGLCDRAIDPISRAIEIAPNYPAYHNNLANAYSQKGNYDSALMCYEADSYIDLEETIFFIKCTDLTIKNRRLITLNLTTVRRLII